MSTSETPAGSSPDTCAHPSPTPIRRPRREELARFEGATVPDLGGPGARLLFVGINPSLWTAAVGAHFARPGNRFWPALAAAGITDRVVDCAAGMAAADSAALIERGVGITNVVPRATARADELTRAELRAGGARLVERVAQWQPRVVAVLGVTAYRMAFDPKAKQGRQDPPSTLVDPKKERARQDPPGAAAPAEWWVLPNPSGLNAHATVESLGRAYAEVAQRAGVLG